MQIPGYGLYRWRKISDSIPLCSAVFLLQKGISSFYGAPCPLISSRQLSLFNDFEIPRAIISSHQGSVQSLCIPSCYLSKHTMPCTVEAWLKSPEFTELQLLEFYYSPGNHIPHTERHELVPSAPMSISRFSSLSTPPPLRCATYQTIWYYPSTPISQETFTCAGLYIGGLIAQHHPLQLPCAGVLGVCFHS